MFLPFRCRAGFTHMKITILRLVFFQTHFPFFIWLFFMDSVEEKPEMFHCTIFVLHKFRRIIILKVLANVKKSLKHRHLNLFDLYIWSTPWISILWHTWTRTWFYKLTKLLLITSDKQHRLYTDTDLDVWCRTKHLLFCLWQTYATLWGFPLLLVFPCYWLVLCPANLMFLSISWIDLEAVRKGPHTGLLIMYSVAVTWMAWSSVLLSKTWMFTLLLRKMPEPE